MKIAVSGKGGVGKTTFSSFLIKALAESGKKVLAIDADPDANLAQALGVEKDAEIVPISEMKEIIEERTEAKTGTMGSFFKLNPKVDDLPEVLCDQKMIQHVFGNLIGNAIKYSSDDKRPKIRIGFDESLKAFYVRDNGIGIEKKYQDAIFGLFTRPQKSTTEGTGVGLAIVKRIVEGEGGVLHLDSARDKGATFYFSLPVVKGAAEG